MPTQFSLNLPPGQPQSEFLAHFNAALRALQESGTGTAAFQADGSFVASSLDRVRIGSDVCTLAFALHTRPDGVLSHIEVEAAEETAVDWAPVIASLVTTALSRALSGARVRSFHRMRLSYFGANLEGEYWIAGFRLGPALHDDPEPYLMNAERVLYLDFHVNAVDENQAMALAQEFTRTQMARFMLLLDFPVVVPDLTMRWVVPPATAGAGRSESVRWQTHFQPKQVPPPTMPEKGELSRLGRFRGSVLDRFRLTAADLVSLPTETRLIFRAITRDEPFRTCVDNCARLYALSLLVRKYSLSASLAYRMASIDAVCRALRLGYNPPEFVRRHLAPSTRLEDLLKALWMDIRSAHFHAGKAPLDGVTHVPFYPFFTSEYVSQSQLAEEGFWVTRQALVTWLVREAQQRVEQDGNGPEA